MDLSKAIIEVNERVAALKAIKDRKCQVTIPSGILPVKMVFQFGGVTKEFSLDEYSVLRLIEEKLAQSITGLTSDIRKEVNNIDSVVKGDK